MASQDTPYPTDESEAEAASELLDELLASPIVIRTGNAQELTELPGVSDSLAAEVVRAVAEGDARLPEAIAPYARAGLTARASVFSRTVFSEGLNGGGGTALLARARVGDGNHWTGGVVVERDAEEPAMPDFASFSLQWQNNSGRKCLIFGASRARIGTGLMLGTSSIPWVGRGTFRPPRASLRPSLSATESGGLLGMAGRFRSGPWDVLFVAARPSWDARVDSTADHPEGVATRVYTVGTHVTDGERERKRALSEQYGLVRIGMEHGRLAGGVSVSRSAFSHPVSLTWDDGQTAYSSQTAAGIDLDLSLGRWRTWGDVAADDRHAWGAAGAVRGPVSSGSLTMAGWHYTPDFCLPHGSGWRFRSDRAGDETGGCLAYDVDVSRTLSVGGLLAGYGTARTSRDNATAIRGGKAEASARLRLSDAWSAEVLLRRREAWRDGIGEPAYNLARGFVTRSADTWSVRMHAEFVSCGGETGLLAAPSLTLSPTRWLRLRTRAAAVHTTDSAAAVYLYEHRTGGYGIVRTMAGTGLDAHLGADVTIGGFRVTAFGRRTWLTDGRASGTAALQGELRLP